ncbi:uncharacterized protein LOC134259755, partial [Saccostrea cucullata]|uniref:uncharacterized protein LOC134259755 n=1 Tax=Saccostrea cuccullata TaxID=36930 RepID=UPI002ED37D20
SCRVNKLKTEFLDIGIQNGASFGHFDNGNLSLTYKSQDGKRNIFIHTVHSTEQLCHSTVMRNKSTLRAVGDMGSFFWLQLRSKYCCPRKREEIPNFSRLGHLLNLIKNRTEEPHPPTIPTPSVVTVTSPPAPDLHQITFLLTGILIVSFLILLILVGGLFWKCIRRNPYAPYSLLPSDDFVENKRQTY